MIDSSNKQIIEIDPDDGEVESKITLNFTPLAWFGIKAEHDDGT